MTCKSCGGELLFQKGTCICQSCGAVSAPEKVYEEIDVFICYVESDKSGRRTKDSIIAQEIYNKLEAKKLSAFYERISADGVVGDQLEMSRYAAIWKAKAILILGASAENFREIEEKYGEHFAGKPVIPFCVDINPGAIPDTLSKIQAISYSTIGWDKDLVKGLYNLLGKEQEVDTGALYEKNRKKLFLIGGIALLLVIGITLAVIAMAGGFGGKGSNPASPAKKAELTPQQIFEKASAEKDNGKYVEALKLLQQIPDHEGYGNLLTQIYAQYEGYYQKDNISLHLEIIENVRADVEITIRDGDNIVRIVESAELKVDTCSFDYTDNHQSSGTILLQLDNAGLHITQTAEAQQASVEYFFELATKSDQPLVKVDAQQLMDWLENQYSYSQILALGYELEFVEYMTSFEIILEENQLFKIKDTDVYLSMIRFYYDGDDEYWFDEHVLVGVAAPASMIAPSLIGKPCVPVQDNKQILWPNGYLYHYYSADFMSNYFEEDISRVSDDTIVGLAINNSILRSDWDRLCDSILEELVIVEAEKTYHDPDPDGYVIASIYGENNTHYLVRVTASVIGFSKSLWYRLNKQDKTISFITEGPNVYGLSDLAAAYPQLAAEFPAAFGITDPEGLPSPSETPNIATVQQEGYNIYSEPSHDSAVVQALPIGAYTIIEEVIDAEGNCWGKLKSGVGWICVSDIS